MDERVLLVEDDASIREVAAIGLRQAGYQVTTCSDGQQALTHARQPGYDLVILDVMLPGRDGLEVCRAIRHDSQVPILMMTARTDTIDVVVGLESGADDYLRKPFEVPELVARVRALLRRAVAEPPERVLTVGPLRIDDARFTAWRDGAELTLTATEFRLLRELARRPGQVFTREMLLARVWDYHHLGDSRLVDVAVQRLRAKLERDPANPRLLRTVRGAGYKLDPP